MLTTGTGSIFGFLIAREAYDSAIMAPLFIAASFLYGLSFTVLVLLMMCRETRQELMTAEMRRSFQGLLVIFSLAVLFLTAAQHLTKFYSAAHRGVELFLLVGRRRLSARLLARPDRRRLARPARAPRLSVVRRDESGGR